MESIVLYIKESYNELLHKVTWPTWPKLLSSTRLVLIAAVMIAVVIFIMDTLFNGLILKAIYNLKF